MINPIRRQIQSMLQVQARAGGFSAVFRVGADLKILPDHFRDVMILPGMCMVQAVLLAAAEARGLEDLSLRVLKNAKMTAPVLPGEEIMIDADITAGADGDILIKAKLSGADRKRAEFSLIAHAPRLVGGTRT